MLGLHFPGQGPGWASLEYQGHPVDRLRDLAFQPEPHHFLPAAVYRRQGILRAYLRFPTVAVSGWAGEISRSVKNLMLLFFLKIFNMKNLKK